MLIIVNKWLALIGLAFFLCACSQPQEKLVHIQGQTMGTYYQVKYLLTPELSDKKQLQIEQLQPLIDEQLELVNNQMSTYRPQSELSLFNKAQHKQPVSPATIKVVSKALQIAEQTDGAFDVTVGPLVNLWGFGPDKKPSKVPSDSLIKTTQAKVGSQYLSIQDKQLVKAKPELYVDLSSIAKGYGVDVIAEFLESKGIVNYLVDIGGELRVHGTKDKGAQWTLAIEKPESGQNVQRLLHIGDNAIATSGDYRNYFESDGIRYSHTIDPKTGKPISHKLASVTVINKSSMVADAYATAITVLGPEKGLNFAKQHQLAVFLLVKTDTGFSESFTEQFTPYLVEAKK